MQQKPKAKRRPLLTVYKRKHPMDKRRVLQ